MGQKIFLELINNSDNLRTCFKSEDGFLKQASKFEKTLKGVIANPSKVRGTKQKPEKSEAGNSVKERKRLKIEV